MNLKIIILSFFIFTSLVAESLPRLIGEKAPSFEVKVWVQSYKDDLDIGDLKGKVVYIATFQDVCPYCHEHGLPSLKELHEFYKDDKGVQFIAIQTAFEDEDGNDVVSAKSVIDQYNLTMPVGNSKRDEYDRPVFMDNYETGGTPWVIIIDKKGIVRYNSLWLHEDLAMVMIDKLKEE